MNVSLRLATMALRALPRVVSPDDESHSAFFELSHLHRLTRDRIELAMHAAAHDRRTVEETDRFLEVFFSPSVKEYLRDKRVLDFGCYFGGTAIAWENMYGTKHISGFDVSPVFIEGANLYAKRVGSTADFRQGYGENAPFPDGEFDTIVAIDVLEHVHNVGKCLQECWRMLAPNGHLIAVFPTYYHPYCHHLKVSNMPLVHWFFSGETLRKAQNGILQQRGPDFAHFHANQNPNYRLPDLNGITVRRARQLIRGQNWDIVRDECFGIPHLGRRAQTRSMKLMGRINSAFARIPGLDELFLDRVAVVLRKHEAAGFLPQPK
jgi:2-polyprenyl-3-methyl-5-hydroxy-6-metoxy-1,4-benzoquinol methylase